MNKLSIFLFTSLVANFTLAGEMAISSKDQLLISRTNEEVSKIDLIYTNHLDSELEVTFSVEQQHHEEFAFPEGCLSYSQGVVKFKAKERKTFSVTASNCASDKAATVGFSVVPRVVVKNGLSTYVSNSIRYITLKKVEKIKLAISAKIEKRRRGEYVVLDMVNEGNSLLTTLGQHVVVLNNKREKIYSGKVKNEYPYFGPTSKAKIGIKIPFPLRKGKYKILVVTIADGGVNETQVINVTY